MRVKRPVYESHDSDSAERLFVVVISICAGILIGLLIV
jgi:hypothetical protein